jgi:hypothetical protein
LTSRIHTALQYFVGGLAKKNKLLYSLHLYWEFFQGLDKDTTCQHTNRDKIDSPHGSSAARNISDQGCLADQASNFHLANAHTANFYDSLPGQNDESEIAFVALLYHHLVRKKDGFVDVPRQVFQEASFTGLEERV